MKNFKNTVFALLALVVVFGIAPTAQALSYAQYPSMYNYGSNQGPYANSYQNQYSYNQPYNYQHVQTPSCSITATAATNNPFGYATPVTLSWSATNATTATISPIVGTVAIHGTRIVSPATDTTYTLTVTGPGGTNTCQAFVYIPHYSNYDYNNNYDYNYNYNFNNQYQQYQYEQYNPYQNYQYSYDVGFPYEYTQPYTYYDQSYYYPQQTYYQDPYQYSNYSYQNQYSSQYSNQYSEYGYQNQNYGYQYPDYGYGNYGGYNGGMYY